MKQRFVFLVMAMVFLSGCGLTAQKSGIEIITYPSAKVLIDGKEAGMTPYKNNSLKPGEIEIRLVTSGAEWTKKIHLENGANTVVNREFSKTTDISGGYILHFEATGNKDKAGLLISTKPDRSTVSIEDEIRGYSPLRLEDVVEGDKKLVVSYPGRKSINTFVKFVNGYQLVVEADLPIEEVVTPVETISATEASSSADKLGEQNMVMIKNTETGWLRVRSTSDGGGVEVAKVKPGEKYKLLEEKGGWYKIDLLEGKSGWISANYAEKLS